MIGGLPEAGFPGCAGRLSVPHRASIGASLDTGGPVDYLPTAWSGSTRGNFPRLARILLSRATSGGSLLRGLPGSPRGGHYQRHPGK